MAENKVIAFLERLNSKTKEGKIPWEKTVEDDIYQATFSGYSVKLLTRPAQDPEARDYVAQIYNEEGTLIEEMIDTDFPYAANPDSNMYRIMKETYELARRKAMGVDKALENLLTQLED